MDDEWEKEFDLEVTEEDLQLAQEAAKKLAAQTTDSDAKEFEVSSI